MNSRKKDEKEISRGDRGKLTTGARRRMRSTRMASEITGSEDKFAIVCVVTAACCFWKMVRNYKKTSSRGEWEKTNMDTAFTEVKEGRMTCLGAARTYNVPEATLRRRLKKNVSNLDVGLDPSYNEDENPTIQSTTSNTTETPGEPEEETIELSERQETVGLVDCAPIPVKKNTSVFDFKPLPKGKPKDKKRKVQKLSSSIITSTPVKMCLEVKQEMKDEKERLKKKREELRASKVSKKLKFGPYKKRPRCMNTASTSKGSEVRCPGCEEKYSDPPVEEWIQCSKCSEWWHENCTSYEGGEFVCDYC
ncbi:hypothetical protein J6590_004861 [Homalodisca vitripennis]|nr:hypothetical protein J6590_004861 [Homalodisca vitripennis]